MKKTIIGAMLFSSLLLAGGDIYPVEQETGYDTEDVVVADLETNDFYVGGSIVASELYLAGKSNWFSNDTFSDTGYGLGLQAGYTFYRAGDFSGVVEGRFNTTIGGFGDDDDYLSAASLLIKPRYGFEDFGVYALGGFGYDHFTYGEVDQKENGFVWGVGLDHNVNERVVIFVDYLSNPSINTYIASIELGAISTGASYKF